MSQGFLFCKSDLHVNEVRVPVVLIDLKDEGWCVFCDLYVFCEGWAALILLSEEGNPLKRCCKTAQGCLTLLICTVSLSDRYSVITALVSK